MYTGEMVKKGQGDAAPSLPAFTSAAISSAMICYIFGGLGDETREGRVRLVEKGARGEEG